VRVVLAACIVKIQLGATTECACSNDGVWQGIFLSDSLAYQLHLSNEMYLVAQKMQYDGSTWCPVDSFILVGSSVRSAAKMSDTVCNDGSRERYTIISKNILQTCLITRAIKIVGDIASGTDEHSQLVVLIPWCQHPAHCAKTNCSPMVIISTSSCPLSCLVIHKPLTLGCL
jgi:hypothetical protein